MKLKLIDKPDIKAILDKPVAINNVRLNSEVKRLIDQHFKSVSKYFSYKLFMLDKGKRPRSTPGPKVTQLKKDTQTLLRYDAKYDDILFKKGYTAQSFLDACINNSFELS